MTILLAVSRLIDAINSAVGRVAEFLVLFCCLISAGNAMIRYLFNYSSNGVAGNPVVHVRIHRDHGRVADAEEE